jgi:glycosyltransferase involved in cell wall biosynthesis
MQNKLHTIGIIAYNILEVGGTGTDYALVELVKRLQKDFFVYIFASDLNMEIGSNVKFIRIPVPQRPFVLKNILFAILGSWKVKKYKIDLIHTTGAVIFNRSDICTIHFCCKGYLEKSKTESLVKYRTNSLLRKINFWIIYKLGLSFENFCYRPHRFKKLVAVSEGIRNELLDNFNYSLYDIFTIPNGVDLARFNPQMKPYARLEIRKRHNLQEHSFICLFVGGLWELRGLSFILQALAQINEDHQKNVPYLIIVGQGDQVRYQQIASSLGIEERIIFAGRREDTQLYYAASDVFIFPSIYEACPLVILEAAASGIPILGTKVNGIDHFIEDGTNGFFIERNAKDIAKKIQITMNDNSLREEMGIAARESVKYYTWDEMYAKYRELYHDLIISKATTGN